MSPVLRTFWALLIVGCLNEWAVISVEVAEEVSPLFLRRMKTFFQATDVDGDGFLKMKDYHAIGDCGVHEIGYDEQKLHSNIIPKVTGY